MRMAAISLAALITAAGATAGWAAGTVIPNNAQINRETTHTIEKAEAATANENGRHIPVTRALRRDAEAKLRAAGMHPGRVDGVVDARTRRALRAYQKAHGLRLTGKIDQATLIALGIGGGPGNLSGGGGGTATGTGHGQGAGGAPAGSAGRPITPPNGSNPAVGGTGSSTINGVGSGAGNGIVPNSGTSTGNLHGSVGNGMNPSQPAPGTPGSGSLDSGAVGTGGGAGGSGTVGGASGGGAAGGGAAGGGAAGGGAGGGGAR